MGNLHQRLQEGYGRGRPSTFGWSGQLHPAAKQSKRWFLTARASQVQALAHRAQVQHRPAVVAGDVRAADCRVRAVQRLRSRTATCLAHTSHAQRQAVSRVFLPPTALISNSGMDQSYSLPHCTHLQLLWFAWPWPTLYSTLHTLAGYGKGPHQRALAGRRALGAHHQPRHRAVQPHLHPGFASSLGLAQPEHSLKQHTSAQAVEKEQSRLSRHPSNLDAAQNPWTSAMLWYHRQSCCLWGVRIRKQ